jgi:primosomal protein N' (replication factor Y)
MRSGPAQPAADLDTNARIGRKAAEVEAYAEVALAAPADRLFTYAIPRGEVVVAGMRVLVPMGSSAAGALRRQAGVVVAVNSKPRYSGELRPIELVLDTEPVLRPELVELLRWAAAYYHAPIGDLLRAALPRPADLKERRFVRLAARIMEGSNPEGGAAKRNSVASQDLLFENPKMAPGGADGPGKNGTGASAGHVGERRRARGSEIEAQLERLLAHVRDRGKLSVERAFARHGSRILRTALRRNLVVLESSFTARPLRSERLYRLVGSPASTPEVEPSSPAPSNVAARARRRADCTAQQREIIETLLAAGGEIPAAELNARASASAIATLRRRAVIEVVSRELPPAQPGVKPRARVALNDDQLAALSAIVRLLPAPAESGESTDSDAAQSATIENSETTTTEDGAPKPGVVLLHGVTGSGKTAVYIEAIAEARRRGLGALMLVPEIGLTPAVFADIADAFPGEVAVLHSALTDAERAQQWRRVLGAERRIVVGTRSAVFAPVARLGIILVDEEHDSSYKQQENPRYNGRDLAVVRGRMIGAPVVLGSATPSLESYTNAAAGKYRLVVLPDRVEGRNLPRIELVDMCAEFRAHRPASPSGNGPGPRRDRAIAHGREANAPDPVDDSGVFSRRLLQAIELRLHRGEQALLLINRRGYSPVMLCRSCGATVTCRDCALSLTYHKLSQALICHLCGFRAAVPNVCPSCGGEYLYFLGTGSQKVEERLASLFPRARIARLDRDAGAGGRAAQILAAFREGAYDILVGTQMIAKGHDVPRVTLVGVVNADLGLALPHFRSGERTFQLLTQVAGRAGRHHLPGEVLFQVAHPHHYAVQAAAAADYAAFYRQEMRYRELLRYPPAAALAIVQVRSSESEQALRWSMDLKRLLDAAVAATGDVGKVADVKNERQRAAPDGASDPDSSASNGRPRHCVRVLGPAPAPVARVKKEYRFQFMLKAESRRALNETLRRMSAALEKGGVPRRAVITDVDPA